MTDSPDQRSRRDSTLSSVGNAARLLKEFGSSDRSIGVTDLSRRLRISKSTAHRLVHTLTEEGLLAQDSSTGAYHLSIEMFILGTKVPDIVDVRAASIPVLEHVRSVTRETVEVSVLDGSDVVAVERREGQQPRPQMSAVGQRQEALAAIGGIVLLAHVPLSHLDAILDRSQQPWAPSTAGHWTPHDVLAQIREQGWADSAHHRARHGAHSVGAIGSDATSVAAPVRNAGGEVVAAISVTGPTDRLSGEVLRTVIRTTMDGGMTMSRRLGYRDTSGAGR